MTAVIPQTLRPIIVYLATVIPGHFFWEAAQLPLYTLWQSGTRREILSAVLHCTAGDALIAGAALGAALGAARLAGWPFFGFRMTAAAILAGIAYTDFSEWLNVENRRSWAYTATMPVVPVLGVGLAPLLQWIIVPPIAFAVASRFCSAKPCPIPGRNENPAAKKVSEIPP